MFRPKPDGTSCQQGFTLLELMVVMVIMAVVVSVGVLNLGGNEQAQLRAQQKQFQGVFEWARDQATFEQKLFLLQPDEKGIRLWVRRQAEWVESARIPFRPWQEGLKVEWKTVGMVRQEGRLGWLVWPSGEVTEGEIRFALSAKADVGESLAWDGFLQWKNSEE
ncbi:prepilin-type N-terminal cleavage/methylation domain-containing protein [Thiomicrorhabdus sp.]|uniref:prepilin-type N-terminal cleavage/methylation domain-containing protein n=1 Tax=Thiomicrorhabdus sp. TaxID=2039724 RepID=UPI0029C91719|nr:prepilin-type N-terminal cleavage/methylation domain-containing protein [Thiomicrorhabdus sp.]